MLKDTNGSVTINQKHLFKYTTDTFPSRHHCMYKNGNPSLDGIILSLVKSLAAVTVDKMLPQKLAIKINPKQILKIEKIEIIKE